MVQPSSQTLALAGPAGMARRPAVAAAVVAPMIASLTESFLVMASSLVCSEAASTMLSQDAHLAQRVRIGRRVGLVVRRAGHSIGTSPAHVRMLRCHLARVRSILAALPDGAWSIWVARRRMR